MSNISVNLRFMVAIGALIVRHWIEFLVSFLPPFFLPGPNRRHWQTNRMQDAHPPRNVLHNRMMPDCVALIQY